MRSEPATPQLPSFDESSAWILCGVNPALRTPSQLMRAQLGFLCGGTPAQSGKSEGHQLAYHMHVETHDALFPWKVEAMTIEKEACVDRH